LQGTRTITCQTIYMYIIYRYVYIDIGMYSQDIEVWVHKTQCTPGGTLIRHHVFTAFTHSFT